MYDNVFQNLNGQVLANVIFNGTNLLRVDLKGVMILVPQVLQALELILSDLEPKFKYVFSIATLITPYYSENLDVCNFAKKAVIC